MNTNFTYEQIANNIKRAISQTSFLHIFLHDAFTTFEPRTNAELNDLHDQFISAWESVWETTRDNIDLRDDMLTLLKLHNIRIANAKNSTLCA